MAQLTLSEAITIKGIDARTVKRSILGFW